MKSIRWPLALLPALSPGLMLVAGCAGRERPVPVAIAPAPPPEPAALAAMPDGASPGMLVPEPLADGSFPTPNQRLSAAGTLWHLRAGLNVAALSCPGDEGAAIRAGYNGWLVRQKRLLGRTVTAYAAEYRGAAFDDAMTRLYNFWAQTPVRPSFCAAAARVVADIAATDPAALPTIAGTELDALDRPFADFYRAYDAWRRGAAAAIPHRPAVLVLDPSSLPVDDAVTG